jgi:thiosulfate dehydrogenase [quinone] large subunit
MASSQSLQQFNWSKEYLLQNPFKSIGVVGVLILRYLFGLYFFVGFAYKLLKDWLWTDKLKGVFEYQLQTLNQLNDYYINELNANKVLSVVEPDSPLFAFEPIYLKYFAIPFYLPIAWMATIGELVIGLSLIFGIAVRVNAAFALFILINFAAGGYFQFHTSFPLMFCSLLIMSLPTGHWLGLDKKFNGLYPDSIWFK